MLNKLRAQFFTLGSFVTFSVAAKLTNYDTSYWAQKLSLGSSVWIMGPPGSDQMRKARYFEYAKACFMSAITTGVTHHLPRPVDDAERARSSADDGGDPPNHA